ncbi:MAG: DUF1553 domain-containing protein [Planctomycetaceae bacterium]
MRFHRLLLLLICLLAAQTVRADDAILYNRDIRPILTDLCFPCHGPDSAARKGDYRLDRRDDAIGKKVIVPGKPDESEMMRRMLLSDPEEVMPPPHTKKSLTEKQKDLLRKWIASGAEYQPHWSFIAPVRPALPKLKNEAWAKNPIDRFVLAKLEERGLTPAVQADRRTLARRVSLDITGLPPSIELVDEFVADKSDNAYEKLIDKLLTSKHWGEHRGRYWLDAARYADTHGIHFDNYREIWAYRDWVISAFNRNVPFDQFTIEQLAGDLLPNKTLDQQVASGFNRCNITTNEGGSIAEEYLVLYTRDRTETVSQVWMGLTTGCAVCHDHKFDPISQREFYSLAAFFNNTTQAAMDGNIPNTPPIITVPKPEDREQWEAVSASLKEMRGKLETRKQAARAEYDKWLADAKVEQLAALVPTEGLKLHAPLNEGQGNSLKLIVDGQERTTEIKSGFDWVANGKVGTKAFAIKIGDHPLEVPEAGDFEKDQGFTASAWVKVTKRNQTGAILARMDGGSAYRGWDLWLQADKPGMHIINAWQTDALKVVGKTPLPPNQWSHVCVTYDGSGKAAGVRIFVNGVQQPVDVEVDQLKSTIRTNVPLTIGQRSKTERLQNVVLQDARVYGRALINSEIEQLTRTPQAVELLAKPADKRTPQEVNDLFDWWLVTFDAPYRELNGRIAVAQQDEVAIKSRGSIAYVMNEKSEEAMAYILFRGEYDKRKDPVKPSTPAALPAFPAETPVNRIGFAQWLLRPEHPLTARVTVNRFWQEVFGTGLVKTAGDFGITGELPSHPELLDWLAVEFRESGWDMKKFFKLILMSNTYQQSAVVTREKLEKDPQNRLLSRGPRFRMDAEMIRDYSLAASGLLVPKLGGPSAKPYQPDGVWEAVAMIGSNTRDYKRDTGENLYRRSLYTFIKRAAPPASMEIFNATARETCIVRRDRTNTPLQALVTLNDVQHIEAARHLAQSVLLSRESDPSARLDLLAKRLLARPFRSDEQTLVKSTLSELLAHYQSHAEDAKQLITFGESKPDASLDPATLAAWTMLANELLNLDEVLTK